MVLECVLLESILLHVQGLNCEEGIYELEDHVRKEALSSNLLLKLGLVKRIPPTCFLNHMLHYFFESNPYFPMPSGPPMKGQSKTPLK
jgi:hypothetical protein